MTWMLYEENPTRLCKSAHGAVATSIFRCKNKFFDASCRSSCGSTTREIGKKTWGVPRENLRVRWRRCDYRHFPVTSIRSFARKNSPHFFLIEITTWNVHGSSCIICVAAQIADSVSRSSDRRVFLHVGCECATLGPQTSRCVKWYLHKLRFIRRAECNVETSITSSRNLETLQAVLRARNTHTHVIWQLFPFYWNSFKMHARCVSRKTRATSRRLSIFFEPINPTCVFDNFQIRY